MYSRWLLPFPLKKITGITFFSTKFILSASLQRVKPYFFRCQLLFLALHFHLVFNHRYNNRYITCYVYKNNSIKNSTENMNITLTVTVIFIVKQYVTNTVCLIIRRYYYRYKFCNTFFFTIVSFSLPAFLVI